MTPPLYVRRIDGKGGFDLKAVSDAQQARAGRSFMGYWKENVRAHRDRGDINSMDYDIAMALATFSDDAGKAVWPSHQTIGGKVQRSTRTVGRSLAKLRALGLVEWAHRFLAPRRNNPLVRATTNMYVFRLSDWWFDTEFEERRARTNNARSRAQKNRLQATGRVTEKKQPPAPKVDSAVAYIAQADYITSWDQAIEEVIALGIDNGVEQLKAVWPIYRPTHRRE